MSPEPDRDPDASSPAYTVRVSSQYSLIGLVGLIKRAADEAGMSVGKMTMLVTSAYEIGHQAVIRAEGSQATVSAVRRDGRLGVQVVLREPGEDVAEYLAGGPAERLVDHVDVQPTPGEGTAVVLTSWA